VHDSLHNGARPVNGVVDLEDAKADEDTVTSKLHHERGIGQGGDSPRGEMNDREAAQLLGVDHGGALTDAVQCLTEVAAAAD
jgi:hypothetical protein